MENEVVDTTPAPAETSAEPTEPTEVQEEQSVEEQPVEEAPPAYITPDQMQEALSKQDASFRSWLGRRDKETLNHIGNVINQKLAKQESPDEVSTRLLENPREVIRSEMQAYESERTQKQTSHLNSTMDTVGMIMESDPLYLDKTLGNEVVAEIKQMVQTNKINPNLPPEAAGKLALADAVVNVYRRRAGVKTNPLSANAPANTGPGLAPPAKPAVKVKMPQLDEVTKKMAEKWGYNAEDLARVYGE